MTFIELVFLLLFLGVPLFFAIWSYISDPNAFTSALSARIQFIAARLFVMIKYGGVITATILYVIFDPIMIIVDDILVVWAATFYIKRNMYKIVQDAFLNNYPFPKPWKEE